MALAEEQVRGKNELSKVAPSPGLLSHEGCISHRRAKGQRVGGSLGIDGLFGKVDSSV